MTQDKILKKALESQSIDTLPTDFNSRLMTRIYAENETKKKRIFVLGISAISTASLCLISLGIYLLKDYITFSFQLPVLSSEAKAIYGFSFYIAFLVSILIVLDSFFRTIRQKRKKAEFK
ncbi:MAG: hypothetical protein P4L34_09190 [Paludibacter sp.]|nr:hypothetical protein [Paludibacter sp.]